MDLHEIYLYNVKVEGVALAVIGRRLVSHLPLSKGYKRIHQCWYDENCTICLPITSKTTPLQFGDRQVEDFLPDSIIYSINRVQSCGSKRDKRYDSTGLLSDK